MMSGHGAMEQIQFLLIRKIKVRRLTLPPYPPSEVRYHVIFSWGGGGGGGGGGGNLKSNKEHQRVCEKSRTC